MTTAQLALVLSLVALAWNVFTAWIRWPRIGVVMRQSVQVTAGFGSATSSPPRDTYYLVVVNNGAEAASIANAGIRSEDSAVKVDIENRRDNGIEVSGPDLPARIEAHGTLVWTLTYDLLGNFNRGTQLVGYAHRYKTLRIVPDWVKSAAQRAKKDGRLWKYIYASESPIRVYETKLRYTKN